MAGFLNRFRKEVITSVWKEKLEQPKVRDIDDKIAFGVLLWAVAEADNKFLPEEEEKIREILNTYLKISEEDMSVVLTSIKMAALERIDLHRFTREVSRNLPYEIKIKILEDLFRVACADRELDDSEFETIRKISGLFNVAHKDFIDAKIKIKKEFGLDTAGF